MNTRIIGIVGSLFAGTLVALAIRITPFSDLDRYLECGQDIVIAKAVSMPAIERGDSDGLHLVEVEVLRTLKGTNQPGKLTVATIYPMREGSRYLLYSPGGSFRGSSFLAVPELSVVELPAHLNLRQLDRKSVREQIASLFELRLGESKRLLAELEHERVLLEKASKAEAPKEANPRRKSDPDTVAHPDARDTRGPSTETKAEIVKLQSSDLRQRSDAIMKLRYLGMRGKATAAMPSLIGMLDSEVEFPQMVLWSASLAPITESCAEECTFGGEAAETLARIGQTSDDLLPLVRSRDWRVRANAIRALGGLRDWRAVEGLLAILQQPTERWEVRGNAALALGLIGDPSAVPVLIAALRDDHPAVRASAARALGELKTRSAMEPLISALQDPMLRVRRKAAGGLGQLKGERAVEALMSALRNDQDRVVREVASAALREIGDAGASSVLIEALQDEYPNVRINAATALGTLGGLEALQPLLDLLPNENEAVRAAAAMALGDLGDVRACGRLQAMVARERSLVPLERGLEALAKLGHTGAKRALDESRRHSPDWEEWWHRNKDKLLKAQVSALTGRP